MSRHLIEPLESRRLFESTFGGLTRFAVIGDYGDGSQDEADVAELVDGWNPDFVVTVGDNNYPVGAADTIDQNIGQFYHQYIYNYQGSYGSGSPTQRFYPALGNHDWGDEDNNPDGADPYLDYFTLPGNERYYEFAVGPVRFFMLDSDQNEPDGTSPGSIQGQWLQNALSNASEPHKVVVMHHAAYSSSSGHGSQAFMQWPYKQWGATAVLQGHDHTYERLVVGGLPYFVNGVGGRSLYGFDAPVAGSQFRYNADYGAMLVEADDTSMTTRFYNVNGTLIDQFTISVAQALSNVSMQVVDGTGAESGSDPITFAINRTGNTSGELVVRYAITGSATNGVDYAQLPASVTIPAGQSSATVTVIPVNDVQIEGNETVTLTILPDVAYNAVPTLTGTATILDNGNGSTPGQPLPAGSVWKYKVTATTPDNWDEPAFNDSDWDSGNARLGYGNAGIVTTIDYGGNAADRYVTTYFRKSFDIASAGAVQSATISLICDDGAAIYLNGQEIARYNMPEFPPEITWSTLAAGDVDGASEETWVMLNIPTSALLSGTNVLAVEVHQSSPTSDDLAFDLALNLTLNTASPTVTGTNFRYLTGPHAVQFTFNTDVGASLAASDLQLVNQTTQALVNASAVQWDGASRTASFLFTGAFAGGVLPDGRYHAALPPGTVTDALGNPILSGAAFDFFFLQGDANHDASCNSADFNILATNFGIPTGMNFGQGDFTYDSAVNSADFNILATQFGKTLPPDTFSRGASSPAGGLPGSDRFAWPGGSATGQDDDIDELS